mgnify:CR=1 FL=1
MSLVNEKENGVTTMNNNKLLLINDLAGYGKVALSAMIPVLSHMKYEVFMGNSIFLIRQNI